MKNFLLDLWHDLRAKRLWPVALVLLAAVVAVPVVLSKDAEAPPAAPPAPAQSEAQDSEGPAALAEVKLEELGQGTGSSLSSFDDPSNPFAPPPKVLKALSEQSQGAAEGGTSGGSGSGGEDAKLEGGSLGGGAGDTGGGGTGSTDTGTGQTGTGDTGTGDTGTGDTDTPDTGDGDGDKPTTTTYTYVADVSFRANNKRRKIKAMEKLDILPDAGSPLLIFLGVTPDAGNAVFLVDSTLAAAGEGSCKPSRTECAFLYLGPGSEHEFTNEEGDSYTLRVDEIRRVKLDKDDDAKAAKKGKKDKKLASAAVGKPAPARRFVPPLLADLVSVSSGGGSDSNTGQDRR
jgi:hypothetical protein